MTDSNEGDRPEGGVVERLARDDVERKHFLKMAGKGMGSVAAATGLAAFIAACGSSSSRGRSTSPAPSILRRPWSVKRRASFTRRRACSRSR